ncbi:MAG TPA: YciI family protein [Gemmatimonadales bacterium]|nr:YciI family protein [Gemmatimonadales bacterium]
MRVMVLVKATKQSEEESNPLDMEGAEEMFEQMGKYNEELVKAGIMLAGDGLKPTKFAKRIHFNGTKRSVTDGPFAETKELVAGFWIWQVRSMEEAVEWAKRCPNPMPGPSDLEIRPIWEAEEFSPEIAAEVNELRDKIAKKVK